MGICEDFMKSVNFKLLVFTTLVIQSGLCSAEKYEAPAFFHSESKKPISFKQRVVNKKATVKWQDGYTVDQDEQVEKSKRLPSSKNSKVKYWDYENKK